MPLSALLNKENSSLKATEHSSNDIYIHGYSEDESRRLNDQANSIAQILHWDSKWPEGSTVLEAGCGVGAQTKTIAPMNPTSNFISVDISPTSIEKAKETLAENHIDNVALLQADIFNLPFADDHFDHVFICFVLEHFSNPDKALQELQRVLKPNGSITVIEGDHGSTYFYPDSMAGHKVIEAQILLQSKTGGNANISRALYPLLSNAGLSEVKVSPRQVYVDDSKPELVTGFIRNTFTAMIKGIKKEVIDNQIMDAQTFDQGIGDLYKTSEGGGSFCYTFFKAIATKAGTKTGTKTSE